VTRRTLVLSLVGALGCTTAVPAPRPPAVGRIAVLPPRGPERADADDAGATADAPAPRVTVGEVLAAAARAQLAAQGFAVVDAARVAAATGGRQPTDAAMAARIVADADLDATAMFIVVQIWQPSYEGMRTDSVIVALDVDLVDPRTGQSLWHVHRAAKPVPLYGTLLIGQADVFAAETVMREVLAPLGPTPVGG
jgi:hypothetical protein